MCAGEPCESTQRSANTTTKAKRLNQVQSRRTRNKRQNQIQHSHNNGQPLRKYCMAVGSGQACISPQKTTGPLLSMRDIQLNQQLHRNRARFDLLPCFKFNSTAISTVSRVSWALPSYQPSHTKNVSQCRKGTGRRHNYSFSSVRPWQSTWLVSLSPLNAQFGTKLHALYIYAEVLDVTTTRMSACRKATGAHKERKQAIQQHSTAEPGNKTNLLGSTSSQNKTPAQTGPKFKVKPFQKYKKGEKSEERKKRGNQRNRQSGE